MPTWLPSAVWLALLILFAVVEALTVGLASIWFAAGALVALLSTYFTANIWLQIVLFFLVSAVTMILVRPLTRKYLEPRVSPTNADRILGAAATVTQEVDNLKGTGTVQVGTMPWSARSEDGRVLAVGEQVTVLRIEGVKLFVAPVSNLKKEEL